MLEDAGIVIVLYVGLLLTILIVFFVMAYNVGKIKKFHFKTTIDWWNEYRKHIYFGNYPEALTALQEVVWKKSEEERTNLQTSEEMDHQYKLWKDFYSPLFEQCGGRFPDKLEFDKKEK